MHSLISDHRRINACSPKSFLNGLFRIAIIEVLGKIRRERYSGFSSVNKLTGADQIGALSFIRMELRWLIKHMTAAIRWSAISLKINSDVVNDFPSKNRWINLMCRKAFPYCAWTWILDPCLIHLCTELFRPHHLIFGNIPDTWIGSQQFLFF